MVGVEEFKELVGVDICMFEQFGKLLVVDAVGLWELFEHDVVLFEFSERDAMEEGEEIGVGAGLCLQGF